VKPPVAFARRIGDRLHVTCPGCGARVEIDYLGVRPLGLLPRELSPEDPWASAAPTQPTNRRSETAIAGRASGVSRQTGWVATCALRLAPSLDGVVLEEATPRPQRRLYGFGVEGAA
jgi:hypothetical protein